MPDTVLKSIALRNWTTVRDAIIEFPEKGLVMVGGLNLTSKGKLESIGSGKTALGEAISRSLLGVPGRYAEVGRYSYKKKGNALITLNCEHRGKPLLVELGFKAAELDKNGEALRFTYDGQQVWRDRIAHTRSDLTKMLAVTPDLAKWTVYFDGDKLKFDDLSQRTSVELLLAALAQPPWTDYHKQANLTVTNLSRDLKAARAEHENLRSALSECAMDIEASQAALEVAKSVYDKALAENAGRLVALQEELDAKTKAHTTKNTRMLEIKKEIKKLTSTNADKRMALEVERNRCIDELNGLKEEHSTLLVSQSEAKSAHTQANDALTALTDAPKSCPTCNRPWPVKHSQESIKKAQQVVTSAVTVLQEATKRAQAKQVQVVNARATVTDAEERLQAARAEAPVQELSEEYEELEGDTETLGQRISQLEKQKIYLEKDPDRSAIVRAEAVIAERQRNQERAQKAVETSAANLVESEETLRIAEYWQDAFGPTGIPNMILKDALAPLNETSRRISALMTGNSIQVSYETTKALASGKEKAELNILVDNPEGADSAEGESKGEAGLTNLIIAETLAEVGGVANRVGYRWYDEIAPNADEVCRRSIFAYLKEIANRYGILVFVVSHSPEAASYADYFLTAEKTAQGTTYRWD